MVTVFVQAVPSRMKVVRERLFPQIQDHGFQDVYAVVDTEGAGPLANFKRILQEAGDDDILYLQDDVVLHRQFGALMIDLVFLMRQGHMISLFCPPRQRYMDAYERGQRFVTERGNFLWMQGMLIPRGDVKGILEYAEDYPPDHRHDDVLVKDYLVAREREVHITLPSMVQHDLNLKSEMGTAKTVGGKARRSPLWPSILPEGWFHAA